MNTETTQTPARKVSPKAARIAALSASATLGLSAVMTAPAWAHDTLIASTPEADEVLAESPEEIVLEFSGDGLTVGDTITNDIWVLDEDDENWATEEPADVEGSTMSTDLAEDLPNGEYEVLYRVVYSDGHDEELSFSFEVDDPAADAAGQDETEAEDQAQDDAGQEGAQEDSPEQEGTNDETGEGSDPTPEPGLEDASDEEATQEDQFPVWAAAAIGAGAVAVVALIIVLVRKKLKQADEG